MFNVSVLTGVHLAVAFGCPLLLVLPSLLSRLLCRLPILFSEVSLRVLCPFSSWIAWFFYCWILRVLYIFSILLLVRYVVCKYCLPVCGLSFSLFTQSFVEQFFILTGSNLSTFTFTDCAFKSKVCLVLDPKDFLLLLLLLSRFSRVRLCATPQTAAHQDLPSLGFSRQEYWSGLPFPPPMQESGKWKWSRSVVSDSSRPYRLQPTRLLGPWDFPGKSTGMGCHCLLRSFLVAAQ